MQMTTKQIQAATAVYTIFSAQVDALLNKLDVPASDVLLTLVALAANISYQMGGQEAVSQAMQDLQYHANEVAKSIGRGQDEPKEIVN